MDAFFASIEASSFSIWMRESPALYAFPGILAVHTVGLALLAGLSARCCAPFGRRRRRIPGR